MKNDPDVESDNNDDAEEKAHKQFFQAAESDLL